ncbi:uncharacterized protein LOC62_07G009578 [Vanrija pseudolonga]|uniref:Uncharacterized protein n=1 Tax=Vanrija pseudolonga TaxID=143232 RepID=A0AAF0YIY0_9TREE|nr:hypothetical protein LOC62_07G009578 [Vanrija pseudolonga]
MSQLDTFVEQVKPTVAALAATFPDDHYLVKILCPRKRTMEEKIEIHRNYLRRELNERTKQASWNDDVAKLTHAMANLHLGASEAQAEPEPVKCATCKSIVSAPEATKTRASRGGPVAETSPTQESQQLSTEDTKQADASVAHLSTLSPEVISDIVNTASPNVSVAPIAMTSSAGAEQRSAISDATSTTAVIETVPALSPSAADTKPSSQGTVGTEHSLETPRSLNLGSDLVPAPAAATPGAHSKPAPTGTPSPPVPQVPWVQSEIRERHWTQRSAFFKKDYDDDDTSSTPLSSSPSSSSLVTVPSANSTPAELGTSERLPEVNTLQTTSSSNLQDALSAEITPSSAPTSIVQIEEAAANDESPAVRPNSEQTDDAGQEVSASPAPSDQPAEAEAASPPSTSVEPVTCPATSSATGTSAADPNSSTPPNASESLLQSKSESAAMVATSAPGSPGIPVSLTNDTAQSQAPKRKVTKAARGLRRPAPLRSAISSTSSASSPSPLDSDSTSGPADTAVITPFSEPMPLPQSSDVSDKSGSAAIATMKPFVLGLSLVTTPTPAIEATAPSTNPKAGPALVKEEPMATSPGDIPSATTAPNAAVEGSQDCPPRLSDDAPTLSNSDHIYARLFFKKVELSNAQWQALHYELRMPGDNPTPPSVENGSWAAKYVDDKMGKLSPKKLWAMAFFVKEVSGLMCHRGR